MKIFSKDQIDKSNKATIEHQNISSANLIERAGIQIFNWMDTRMQGAQVPIHVFCGIGENGSKGLVLARYLILEGYIVNIYIVDYNNKDKRSENFSDNYNTIKNITKNWPILLSNIESLPKINSDDVIVDAIYGMNLNKPVANWIKVLFKHFKACRAFVLSIDIPTGVYMDKVVEDENAVVWADYTLCFTSPKLIFFLPETSKFSLKWEVLDISLDQRFLIKTKTNIELIGKHEVLLNYIPRDKFANKGVFGHALIIGGSYGKIGAVSLAGRAALSAGAGLVSVFTPKCGYIPLQTALPEIMVITDDNEKNISAINFDITPTIIGIGVGLGVNEETIYAFESFLKKNKTPLVIDADGINILSKKKDLLELLPPKTIITPHPKELKRLIGAWENDFDKLEKAKEFSKKHQIILIIKGANTITVFDDKLYINTTGNPGLSTAGSGDVLTGIITGLISQGYTALIAAVFGVYLHGKSGDIAVENYSYQSLIASHITDYLGKAFIDLFNDSES